jgi:hypothetical protein
MTSDDRLTWRFITDVLDVPERHGHHRGDNEHTGQAIGLIRDVARIYEGTLDASRGGYVVVPSSRPAASPPAPPAAVVSADQVKILLAALGDAAEYKRDRAGTCAGCAGQSCTTCEWRLQTAGACDQLAGHMIQAAGASGPRQAPPSPAAPGTGGPPSGAGREAGQ